MEAPLRICLAHEQGRRACVLSVTSSMVLGQSEINLTVACVHPSILGSAGRSIGKCISGGVSCRAYPPGHGRALPPRPALSRTHDAWVLGLSCRSDSVIACKHKHQPEEFLLQTVARSSGFGPMEPPNDLILPRLLPPPLHSFFRVSRWRYPILDSDGRHMGLTGSKRTARTHSCRPGPFCILSHPSAAKMKNSKLRRSPPSSTHLRLQLTALAETEPSGCEYLTRPGAEWTRVVEFPPSAPPQAPPCPRSPDPQAPSRVVR